MKPPEPILERRRGEAENQQTLPLDTIGHMRQNRALSGSKNQFFLTRATLGTRGSVKKHFSKGV